MSSGCDQEGTEWAAAIICPDYFSIKIDLNGTILINHRKVPIYVGRNRRNACIMKYIKYTVLPEYLGTHNDYVTVIPWFVGLHEEIIHEL